MSKKTHWTARKVHLWIGIVLALPMTIIAVSGILIAMRSITTLDVPMAWMGAETVPTHLPITAYLEAADGSIWIGNAQGLTQIVNGKAQPISQFTGQEVTGLAAVAEQPFPLVATKMSVWAPSNGGWSPVLKGRVRQLSSRLDGSALAIVGGRGEMADSKPMITHNALDWQPYAAAQTANALLPPLDNPRVSLHLFMREIHSGAYWFGKGPGEMIWANVMGWILVTLSLTGLWMWLRMERQKARNRCKQRQIPATHTASPSLGDPS